MFEARQVGWATGPVTMHRWGEFRPPGGQNPAFVGLCSQGAPLEPRELGLSKNWVNTAFSLGTHLISFGVRGGRGMREKGMVEVLKEGKRSSSDVALF